MARGARPTGRTLAYTTALGFLAAGLMGWHMMRPESALEGSLRKALADNRLQTPATVSTASLPSETFGAALWLSALKPQRASGSTGPLQIGQELAFTRPDGHVQRLQVVDVRPAQATFVDRGTVPSSSMLLVTLRAVGQDAGNEVRLLVDAASPPAPPAPAHTL